MDLQPWRNTLDTITGPRGWIGRSDAKSATVQAVLAGYAQPAGWIGHGFDANLVRVRDPKTNQLVDRCVKPDAAYAAEIKRDAILQLAVVHELLRWGVRQRTDEPDVAAELAPALVDAAMRAPLGLRAKSVSGQPQSGARQEVDFAHSHEAKVFFETTVRERLERVDKEMKTRLAEIAGERYEPSDEASIERWGRAWSAGASVVCLDWARRKRCHTAGDLARALWSQTDPEGRPLPHFYPRGAVIPTSTALARTAHAELHTRAAIAFALAGNEAIRALDDGALCTMTFALKAIDYVAAHSGVRYNGYNGSHMYLAVWSDLLCAANGEFAMSGRGESESVPQQGDARSIDGLSPEHLTALANTTAARETVRVTKKALDGRRFSTGQTNPASRPGSDGTRPIETPIEWEPLSQRAMRLLPESDVAGARWQPLASLELWRALGPDRDWIDLLVVARIGDRQIALPVTLHEAATDTQQSERGLLVLDEGARPAVSTETLRNALAKGDAAIGVAVRKGLGAFVVLEIEVSAAGIAARGSGA